MAVQQRLRRLTWRVLRKRECAWMSDGDRPRLYERMGADLAERRPRLFNHQIDHVSRPGLPQRAEAPEKGLAGKSRMGTQRDRADHVEPAADAAVHHRGGPASHLRHDGSQHIDRRRQGFDLTPAMVRYPDALDA